MWKVWRPHCGPIQVIEFSLNILSRSDEKCLNKGYLLSENNTFSQILKVYLVIFCINKWTAIIRQLKIIRRNVESLATSLWSQIYHTNKVKFPNILSRIDDKYYFEDKMNVVSKQYFSSIHRSISGSFIQFILSHIPKYYRVLRINSGV